MRFSVLTVLPQLFDSYLGGSIIKRAIDKKLIKVDLVNIRDFATNKHKQVDDSPCGGGPGLVMMCQPIFDAIKQVSQKNKGPVIFLTPSGKTLKQSTVRRLAKQKEIILLCGRYEGVDQRVIDNLVDEEISIGSYVLTGGELPALIFIDAISRLLPGVLHDDSSSKDESFSVSFKGKKEYPQYTKPEDFRGLKVPEVLMSGHHAEIEKWRRSKLR